MAANHVVHRSKLEEGSWIAKCWVYFFLAKFRVISFWLNSHFYLVKKNLFADKNCLIKFWFFTHFFVYFLFRFNYFLLHFSPLPFHGVNSIGRPSFIKNKQFKDCHIKIIILVQQFGRNFNLHILIHLLIILLIIL